MRNKFGGLRYSAINLIYCGRGIIASVAILVLRFTAARFRKNVKIFKGMRFFERLRHFARFFCGERKLFAYGFCYIA